MYNSVVLLAYLTAEKVKYHRFVIYLRNKDFIPDDNRQIVKYLLFVIIFHVIWLNQLFKTQIL